MGLCREVSGAEMWSFSYLKSERCVGLRKMKGWGSVGVVGGKKQVRE